MEKQLVQSEQASSVQLMTALRSMAEEAASKEGLSLDEFVNAAVTEKLEHFRHTEWVKGRSQPSAEGTAQARRILRSAGSEAPQSGDELPEGYVLPELG
jgi:hypothetical protein